MKNRDVEAKYREKGFYSFSSAWEKIQEEERKQVFALAEDYKLFLDNGKIERECVEQIVSMARVAGFVDLEEMIQAGRRLEPGIKVMVVNRNKAVALFVIGKKSLSEGLYIVGSHIDSPRLDLKPQPLYEDSGLALLKTHYYGGIKKYQWATLPLAIHGVFAKKDGSIVHLNIGEREDDPLFVISDILPHLGKAQASKTMSEGISGENLNVILGHIPVKDDDIKEKVKLGVLQILTAKYGVDEADFTSAEIEIVPAGRSRDAGLDRGLILAYGHDDRSCAFASLRAILDVEHPVYTASALFVDKEEIGSMGSTGMESVFYENTVAELLALEGEGYSEINLRRAFSHSRVLSADVDGAFDPTYPEPFDKRNASFMGNGVVVQKYTGSRGKYGSNDASAEFVASIRALYDENNVVWQTGELGKVDEGGGGTIAYILANRGADVIDCGVPVLSMHAPWELISKVDLYMAWKGYRAFLQSK
ncbi:aminopeptidase [Aminobacterium sp. MB27-C1]|uniref:aminopeptidase n=1 Tax=Aminobacterium sp. MB27-C1 TaxID=3070661 RepID=UPI001BCBC04E|nr:aminopeptidase [Aminobacterium sp. MB27-C1]WMI72284.1 aminopeptidase [Aminobacterium sp. MB27-C1]